MPPDTRQDRNDPIRRLPTLELARAELRVRSWPSWMFWSRANLLKREPDTQRKVAALWLDARLLIRSTRHSEENVGPRTRANLPDTELANPSEFGGRSRYIARLIDASPVACSFCSMSPGSSYCSACGGEGVFETMQTDAGGNSRTVMVPCTGCSGGGMIECGACDGSATTQRIEMAWVEDEWKTLRYAYAPNVPFAMQSKIRAYMEAVDVWPAHLKMPLEEQLVSGPYRSGPSAVEEFKGFVVDGPIDEARAMVERIRGGGRVLQANVSAHVLPIVWLRYPKASVAVHSRVDEGFGVLVVRD